MIFSAKENIIHRHMTSLFCLTCSQLACIPGGIHLLLLALSCGLFGIYSCGSQWSLLALALGSGGRLRLIIIIVVILARAFATLTNLDCYLFDNFFKSWDGIGSRRRNGTGLIELAVDLGDLPELLALLLPLRFGHASRFCFHLVKSHVAEHLSGALSDWAHLFHRLFIRDKLG